MRTLPPGIVSELATSGSQPGYLVEITTQSGIVVRLTTFDIDYVYSGETYTSADLTVPAVSWDGSVKPGAQLEFGDMDIIVWVAALYREFDDAIVRILLAYAGTSNAAFELFRGRCGKPSRTVDPKTGSESATLQLDAESTVQFAPRERIQDKVDQVWLIPAGALLLVNDQRWIIDRPKTANI